MFAAGKLWLATGALALGPVPVSRADDTVPAPAAAKALPEVEVVATGLFPGIGVPADLVPIHVQRISHEDVARLHEHEMGEVLNSAATGVNVNDTQGNPFQRDVTYRGFAASPVLGTPQGISVYIDGVRINEAFGDTVSWDLISPNALSELAIIPGSNPVYGLNTLAGAISITTKRGFNSRGGSLECTAGSFARQACSAELGGISGDTDYYATADRYQDRGWGQQNPSTLQHAFAQVGRRLANADVSLSVTAATSDLFGNQTIPVSFLDNPSQAYTYPDETDNRLFTVNLKGRTIIADAWTLAGTVHYRQLSTQSVNSNVNGGFDPTSVVSVSNSATQNVIDHIAQRRPGASVQASRDAALLGSRHSLTVGAEWERGHTEFTQQDQAAGFARNTYSLEATVLSTHLTAMNELKGIYANDVVRLTDRVSLSLTTRYSRAHTQLNDLLGSANNGDDTYSRWLPAAGLSWQMSPLVRGYANYGEAMRVPSPVESTCANPSAPCQLPNAFVSDPPLKAVRAQSFEVGLDGRLGGALEWNVAVFRTTLLDDIQFVGAGAGSINSGYFQNIGATRRQGLELGLNGRRGRLRTAFHYAFTDATFRSPLEIFSPNNSSNMPASVVCGAAGPCSIDASGGTINVHPGDRLPGVPRHNVRVRVDLDVDSNFGIGAEVQAQSSQYARGDENNQDARGPMPGFAVVNLDARYAARRRLSLYARVSNLFDRRYSTFGVLGTNYFAGSSGNYVSPVPITLPPSTSGPGPVSNVPDGGSTVPGAPYGVTTGVTEVTIGEPLPTQFRSVGTPRGAWLGATYSFGGV